MSLWWPAVTSESEAALVAAGGLIPAKLEKPPPISHGSRAYLGERSLRNASLEYARAMRDPTSSPKHLAALKNAVADHEAALRRQWGSHQ